MHLAHSLSGFILEALVSFGLDLENIQKGSSMLADDEDRGGYEKVEEVQSMAGLVEVYHLFRVLKVPRGGAELARTKLNEFKKIAVTRRPN